MTTFSRILQQIPDFDQLTANQLLDQSEGPQSSKPSEDTCTRYSVLWTSKFRRFLCLYSCFPLAWTTTWCSFTVAWQQRQHKSSAGFLRIKLSDYTIFSAIPWRPKK